MTLKTKRIIKKNLQKIKLNIKKHSPHPQKVQIIAVTKTLTNEAITSAINNNIFNIGESKVQETQTKLQNYQKPEKLNFGQAIVFNPFVIHGNIAFSSEFARIACTARFQSSNKPLLQKNSDYLKFYRLN